MSALIPSATIIPLRNTENRLELLMVRRNKGMQWGNEWVFPGGKIEPEDRKGEEDGMEMLETARNAAIREIYEEAGLRLETERLVPMSRWTTPPELPKRFITWFFLSEIGMDDVQIDGGEIIDFQWITPQDALKTHREGALKMPPPTFVTLTQLSAFSDSESALSHFRRVSPTIFIPRIIQNSEEKVFLYPDDGGYPTGDIHADGPRHRLRVSPDGWFYQPPGSAEAE